MLILPKKKIYGSIHQSLALYGTYVAICIGMNACVRKMSTVVYIHIYIHTYIHKD